MNTCPATPQTYIIGLGPAGAAASYTLTQNGRGVRMLEADTEPGGLARTVSWQGARFDIGGHRFYTQNRRLSALVDEIVGADLVEVERHSRIYFQKQFFDYPLRFREALPRLGLIECGHCILDYMMRPHLASATNGEQCFEDWAIGKYGRRLYELFFKDYTEKTWGIPCTNLSGDWATQRIQEPSLWRVIWNMLRPSKDQKRELVNTFWYPKTGIGALTEQLVERSRTGGASLHYGCRVTKVSCEGTRVSQLHVNGEALGTPDDQYISSMPLNELLNSMNPSAPAEILQTASRLKFRDLVTVTLLLDQPRLSPDSWVYVQDASVPFCRFHEPPNWSRALAADPQKTHIVVEYFCTEGDDTWDTPSGELVRKTVDYFVHHLGLLDERRVIGGTSFRWRKAYPILEVGHRAKLKMLYDYLRTFENLHVVGRNGQFFYDDMSHPLLTGILAAENVMGSCHDLFEVNRDAIYREAGESMLQARQRPVAAAGGGA